MKELSKLSTSIAGRFSLSPSRPSLSSPLSLFFLSPLSLSLSHTPPNLCRDHFSVSSAFCNAFLVYMRQHSHTYMYRCTRAIQRGCWYIRDIRIDADYTAYPCTNAPPSRSLLGHSVIYLFIYSERLERARHFMNTILGASADCVSEDLARIFHPLSDGDCARAGARGGSLIENRARTLRPDVSAPKVQSSKLPRGIITRYNVNFAESRRGECRTPRSHIRHTRSDL